MPTRSSGLPQSYHVNSSASGSGAPSRPGKNRNDPLYSRIDKEVTVASRVVWTASSARAHQGPATIHASARIARARTERTDRISNLRMQNSLALRPCCVTGSGCYAAAASALTHSDDTGSLASLARIEAARRTIVETEWIRGLIDRCDGRHGAPRARARPPNRG